MSEFNVTKARIITTDALRRFVGYLGILLAFILLIGGCLLCEKPLQSTVSAYYYTCMRDVFVGVMFLVGSFLVTYRGHDSRDDWITTFAGLFAFTTGLVPPEGWSLTGAVHFGAATLFILFLAIMSHDQFSKCSDRKMKQVYKDCGVIVLGCLVVIGLYILLQRTGHLEAQHGFIFWMETLALVVFGFSWLAKGDAAWTKAAVRYWPPPPSVTSAADLGPT